MTAKEVTGKRRRGGGFRAAGDEAAAILSPVLKRRGFAHADILRRWTEIVGPALADHCRPERLQWPREAEADKGATLHLLAASGWAIEVQHMAPLMIERINRFFGWRAVGQVKLRQGIIQPRPRKKAPEFRALTTEEQASLDKLLETVSDPKLRATLHRLGEAIYSRE